MATSLPSWLLPAAGLGVGLLVLAAVVGGPSADERPRAAGEKAATKRVKSAALADKTRAKADHAYAAMGRRIDRAEATLATKGTKTASAKVAVVERKVDRIEEIQARIDSGSYTPSELKEWMASGVLKIRNPEGGLFGAVDDSGNALERAKKMSEQFHGTDSEVMELSPAERHISQYVVSLGPMPDLDYEPRVNSDRNGWIWTHQSGDRGDLVPKAKGKPVLAVDPVTKRPVLVMYRTGMKFDENRGLVG